MTPDVSMTIPKEKDFLKVSAISPSALTSFFKHKIVNDV